MPDTVEQRLALHELSMLKDRLTRTRAALNHAERRGASPRMLAMMRETETDLQHAVLDARARVSGITPPARASERRRERACLP